MKLRKTIILLGLFITISWLTWYGGKYYTAGLIDQTALIEYGMEEDFIHCNKWRPEKFNKNKKIEGYKVTIYIMKTDIIVNNAVTERSQLTPVVKDLPRMSSAAWASSRGYTKILPRLEKYSGKKRDHDMSNKLWDDNEKNVYDWD